MRKMNISRLLPTGFLTLFLILLVFGIRELRIINNHKQLNEQAKELFKSRSVLNENLLILKTEKFILNNIIATNDFAEFELALVGKGLEFFLQGRLGEFHLGQQVAHVGENVHGSASSPMDTHTSV